MLCLDISRAFNNILHQRLLYNVRIQGYPNYILRFLSSFLQDRTTQLYLGSFLDIYRPQDIKILQGLILSPILFLFFASTLLPILETGPTTAIGFVDDTNILIYSKSTKDNCRRPEQAYYKYAKQAECYRIAFALQKYQLIYFTRSRTHYMKAMCQDLGNLRDLIL